VAATVSCCCMRSERQGWHSPCSVASLSRLKMEHSAWRSVTKREKTATVIELIAYAAAETRPGHGPGRPPLTRAQGLACTGCWAPRCGRSHRPAHRLHPAGPGQRQVSGWAGSDALAQPGPCGELPRYVAPGGGDRKIPHGSELTELAGRCTTQRQAPDRRGSLQPQRPLRHGRWLNRRCGSLLRRKCAAGWTGQRPTSRSRLWLVLDEPTAALTSKAVPRSGRCCASPAIRAPR